MRINEMPNRTFYEVNICEIGSEIIKTGNTHTHFRDRRSNRWSLIGEQLCIYMYFPYKPPHTPNAEFKRNEKANEKKASEHKPFEYCY